MRSDEREVISSHPFPPVFDSSSRVLILGSFPSVISRKEEFYYANPQNRFFKVLGAIFKTEIGASKEEKTAFLLAHRIALYDSYSSVSIEGSSDSSLCGLAPSDLSPIFQEAKIEAVLLNGKKALEGFKKNPFYLTVPSTLLPSTSPANAAFGLDKLVVAYRNALSCFLK